MHNLTHSNKIAEAQAMNLIFDACRANAQRATWVSPEGYKVSFFVLGGGHHEAALRCPEGIVIALASVDASDC